MDTVMFVPRVAVCPVATLKGKTGAPEPPEGMLMVTGTDDVNV